MALEFAVEPIGRLALISYGLKNEGKLCTIVDVKTDEGVKKFVVDGPESLTGVARHLLAPRRVRMTQFRVAIPRGVHSCL